MRFVVTLGLGLILTTPGSSQADHRHQLPDAQQDGQLPNGKDQQEEILKADHAKDLKDVAQLVALCEQLQADLQKNDHNVLSIASIKKTEEIEKLAKRIRDRMRR